MFYFRKNFCFFHKAPLPRIKNMIFCKIVNLEYVAFYLQRRIRNLEDYNISQNKIPQSYYHPLT